MDKSDIMQFNLLENTEERAILLCNYNMHIKAKHPDRIINCHDIIYIVEGNWSISQDNIDYELTKDDIILLQANHHHYGIKPSLGVVKTMFIHFESNPSDHLGEMVSDSNNFVFPIVNNCKNNPLVKHYFSQVIQNYWSENIYAKKKASAYLKLLLCELSESNADELVKTSETEYIKNYIKNNIERVVTREELARIFNCTEKTLANKFKASTGTSLHKWQLNLKCKMADELLKANPNITLKEVAATFGFYDEYHFGKYYKKYFGYSPKRERTQGLKP